MPPSDVSICSTDSEVSSLGGGDSDTDHPSNYLLNMGFDEFADEASINSTAFYPVAAIPSLEMDKGQPGRLETVADDLHSWLDVLMAEESFYDFFVFKMTKVQYKIERFQITFTDTSWHSRY